MMLYSTISKTEVKTPTNQKKTPEKKNRKHNANLRSVYKTGTIFQLFIRTIKGKWFIPVLKLKTKILFVKILQTKLGFWTVILEIGYFDTDTRRD